MVVAIITAKWPDVHGLGDLVGTTEFIYLAVFLWLAVAGAGRLSLDHLLGRLVRRPEAAPVAAR